jgi:choice-of-anchor A domain-containing protein
LSLILRSKYDNYGKHKKYPAKTMNRNYRLFLSLCAATAALATMVSPASASVVDLGQAGQFTLLALGGSIDDSGPLGPQGDPYSVNGPVGVVTSGEKFQASGSVTYNGPIFLHSGVGFNSSAKGVPQPTMSSSVDAMLAQAKQDAFAASNFALGLAPTQTLGTVNSNLSITQQSVGNYVLKITSINFSGDKALTLSAPAGSTFVLNISDSIVLTSGSIKVAGGITAADVLINYTGTSDVRFSGGGNTSEVFATILAPNATVGLHPGLVVGSVIANAITMSSGADVVPVPEVAPSSVLFGFLGLIVAFGSRRVLGARVRAVAARQSK